MTRNGLDFEEETKARMNSCPCDYYEKLTLLECLADSMGEQIEYEINPDKIWRSLSLVQRRIFALQKTPAKHNNNAVSKEKVEQINNAGGKQKVDNNNLQPMLENEEPFQDPSSGCFIIPAASCTTPPSKSLLIMPSFSGGSQIHLAAQSVYLNNDQGGFLEYEIPSIIPAGSYNLSCRMVNVHQKQMPLQLTIENFEKKKDQYVRSHCDVWVHREVKNIDIDVQYTIGNWETTTPVLVQKLQPGSVLTFTRGEPCHGLSIKEFILEKTEVSAQVMETFSHKLEKQLAVFKDAFTAQQKQIEESTQKQINALAQENKDLKIYAKQLSQIEELLKEKKNWKSILTLTRTSALSINALAQQLLQENKDLKIYARQLSQIEELLTFKFDKFGQLMPTMKMFSTAPTGVAAAALVKLESGDVSIYVHAVRIEAPVRNQQSQIHVVVQKVLKEVKGVDPSAQFLSNEDVPIDSTVPEDKAEFDNLFSVETIPNRAQDTMAAFVKIRTSKTLRDIKQPMWRWLSENKVWIKRCFRVSVK